MHDEPNGPGPAIVASHKEPQRKKQSPGHVHEYTMEMDIGELLSQARLVVVSPTSLTQFPQFQVK